MLGTLRLNIFRLDVRSVLRIGSTLVNYYCITVKYEHCFTSASAILPIRVGITL